MERGDFIESLLTKLGPLLDQPARDVYFHDVMPLFDDIVKSSTLGRKGSKNSRSILGNLGVKIMESSEGDTGWEVFCLEFRFPELLEYIFSPE